MGDEGAPAAKRRAGGDLRRVAEIVMVLSAMGEVRGGRDPAAAERALAAEARQRLAAACEGVKPKDLFSREAVRVLVEDLGLNRSKDPLMGFRPPRMSIAEKLLLTKRKMEESKELSAHSSVYSSQLLPMGFNASPESHGASFHGGPRFLPDKPSPMPLSAGGFQTASPVVYAPQLSSGASSLKQSQIHETQASVTPIKMSNTPLEKDSSAKVPYSESGHFRLDGRPNGPTYSTQVRASTSVDYLPERNPTASIQSTSSAAAKLVQTNKLPDHIPIKTEGVTEVNPVPTPLQETKDQDLKTSAAQVAPANLLIGQQASHGLTFVHPPSFFTNHNDIAKSVQRVLQQKVSDRPNWTPPSTDYMSSPINCQVCKVTLTDMESLLICDHCERGSHRKCLVNKDIIPKADWHCQKCLDASNGKPLPPKYGRVTRTAAVSKGSSNSSGTHPLPDKRAENTESKISLEKPIHDGNSGLPYSAHASSAGSIYHESALHLGSKNARDTQDVNFPANETKKEVEMSSETSTRHSKERVEAVYDASGRQNDISGKQIEINGPYDMRKSTLQTMLQTEVVSEQALAEHPSGNVAEITCQSHVPSDSQIGEPNGPTIVEGSSSQLCEISKGNMGNLEKPSDSREASKFEASSIRQDDQDNSETTLNESLYSGDETGFSGRPFLSDLHTVDWIGDILQVVGEKIYYHSCHINGTLYKLQDHLLISLNNQKATPSKLHALCEDRKTGSKWAIVNPYHFPSDLPGAVIRPSAPVNNEVYASNNESTIMAGSICGHCEVLIMDMEEWDRRTHLGDADNILHPTFLCRWKYDDSKHTFQLVTS